MNLEPGQKSLYYDEAGEDFYEITIVGFDPYKNKYVAASNKWSLGISHLDDDDINRLTTIDT